MKRIVYSIAILFPLLITSCSDWLDVKPKTETDSDVLFSTTDGFKSALAGIYTGMTDATLYGKEMTFGLVGVLGMEWSTTTGQLATSTNEYYYAANYDYTNTTIKTKVAKIWANAYNAIANTNKLIEYTEKKRAVLSDLNYEIIRGEAFALRAYLHFDIMRLFGSAGFESDSTFIPYVETSMPQISPLRSNNTVLKKLIADLSTAEKLLVHDPVRTGEDYTAIDAGYLANRNYHMNYWAVRALKARVYLYANKKDSALIEANAVITAGQNGLFPWVNVDDVTNTNVNLRDRTFSSEQIFALNDTRLKDQITNYFFDTTTPLFTRLSVTTFGNGALFSEQADYRYFFEENNGISNVYSRFWQMDASNGVSPKKYRMPMLRISEMYYIAAECLAETNLTEAISLIQKVETKRGITNTLSATSSYADFKNELQAEYQREFLGEGQLFFFHKRQHTPIIYNSAARYTLPLPDAETEYRL